ncbi:response regulator [Aquabacterium sp. A7-Y]|uniref:ATP-binding protein n=1 Tax=Aquabacterium sp. A7-Y TaxID=1349605 RepID=UPI00223D189A|nr:ATP-binding protein [Aquabacterium sp. A7-Y]MCW7540832.1 response regulator [Aquabacterium sp. A7-Y]
MKPTSASRLDAPPPAFLLGGGESGARMRATHWADTPLGPPEDWPAPLKTAVHIVLGSRQPMFVWWGPQCFNFYNDACWEVLGARHPDAMGRPAMHTWQALWDQVAPQAASVLRGDQGSFEKEDLQLVMERHSGPEESSYSVSCSAVPDEHQGPGGLIGMLVDRTRGAMAERQLDLLHELAACTSGARTREDAGRLLSAALATGWRDLPFVLLYALDPVHDELNLIASGSTDTQAHGRAVRIELDHPCAGPVLAALNSLQPQLLTQPDAFFEQLPQCDGAPPRHAVVMALPAPGRRRAIGVLVAGLNPLRRFDADYRRLIELVAGQIATRLSSAPADEDERRHAEPQAELERAKAAFFSQLGDEFRTPLTLVLAPLQDLLDDPAHHAAHETLRLVRRNAQRLLKLLDHLLDVSHLEAGPLQASDAPVDPAGLHGERASVFRSAIERAGMRLEIDGPPGAHEGRDVEPVETDRRCPLWSAPAAAPLQPARVLLADDSADMRDYLHRLLSLSHQVVTVPDGQAALEAIRQQPPDLVVADITMPRLDGLGLLRALREDGGTSGLPVILLSACAAEDARLAGLQAGADDYLVKPFSARELLARVDALLALARLRRAAGDALGESEARFRQLADHAPMMVWLSESDGRCSYLSRSWTEFTGQEMPDGLGLGWQQMVHPEDRERVERLFAEHSARHEAFRTEYRLRRRDGHHAWVLNAAQPRYDGSARWLGYVGSVQDISDRKQAEETLRAADRRKDEFLATLAHELRNPLAPIRNGLELMKLAGHRPEIFAKVHDMMERQVGHMVHLIDDLLDVSRLSRGRIDLQRETLDLAAVLAGAQETIRPLIERMGHRLSVELPAEPVLLHGDATRLTQVFANLLNNAARYTDPGGRIAVRAHCEGREARVSVCDNGIGIPPSQLDEVFEMFSQLQGSLERAQGGLGIGLTLARQLVRLHGGRIEAFSGGRGQGCEFVVHLPLAPACAP